jgi:hypothetical protein
MRHNSRKGSVEAGNRFFAAAAGLAVAVLIYLASLWQSQRPVPVVAVTPSPAAIAAPTVEEKAPLTRQAAVQPTAQPTAPVAVAIRSPSTTVALSPTPSAADLLAQAKSYLDAKDFAKALPLLQKAADARNTDAMNNLGLMYERGNGVARDYVKAREWYQKAADAGDTYAMYHLGELYEHAYGVAQDYAKARQYYQKAPEAGYTDAKQALARLPKESSTRQPTTPSPTPSAAESLAQAVVASTPKQPIGPPVAVAIPSSTIVARRPRKKWRAGPWAMLQRSTHGSTA